MPLMRAHGRVVNVSSNVGALSRLLTEIPHPCPHMKTMPTTKLKDAFLSPALTCEQLDNLMNEFISNVRDGTHAKNGWPNSAYSVSKMGVNGLSRILQKSEKKEGLMVYSVCPGWCKTDMSSGQGHKTASEGAETPVWLALQPRETPVPQGFYADKAQRDW